MQFREKNVQPEKNPTAIKVYCKQNRHFYRDFFQGSRFLIGRSQRVEGKQY
jgi:hypothetical protein